MVARGRARAGLREALGRDKAVRSSRLNYFLFFFSFFFHPIYYLRPSILSLLVVTQIRGHIAGSSLPLPNTVSALHFYRENISALSSLVDSRRIVLTHARRSQQLILFSVRKNS